MSRLRPSPTVSLLNGWNAFCCADVFPKRCLGRFFTVKTATVATERRADQRASTRQRLAVPMANVLRCRTTSRLSLQGERSENRRIAQRQPQMIRTRREKIDAAQPVHLEGWMITGNESTGACVVPVASACKPDASARSASVMRTSTSGPIPFPSPASRIVATSVRAETLVAYRPRCDLRRTAGAAPPRLHSAPRRAASPAGVVRN